MSRSSIVLLALGLLVACQGTPATSSGAAAALQAASLRLLDTPEAMPIGTDAVLLRRYELAVGPRTRQLPLALAASLQGDTAIVWLPDHRLARFGLEGAPQLLARDVGSPALVDAQRIVYALEVEDAAEVRVLQQGVETMLARGLASAGVFRLGPRARRVFFVGAVNGGVAGLWVADLSGGAARCLTNCELRTGQPWHDFVPAPGSAESLEFVGDDVRYVDMNGETVTRSFR